MAVEWKKLHNGDGGIFRDEICRHRRCAREGQGARARCDNLRHAKWRYVLRRESHDEVRSLLGDECDE